MPPSGVKVAMVVEGSRGDTQPYIALARGLQKAGFKVKYLSNVNTADFIASHGLDVLGCGLDAEKQLREDEDFKTAMTKGDFMKFAAALNNERTKKEFNASVKPYFTALDAFEPDVIVYGPLTTAVALCYQFARRVPVLRAELQPNVPTKEHAPFGLPSFPAWTGLNMFLWKVALEAFQKGVEGKKDMMEKTLSVDLGWCTDKKYYLDKIFVRLPPLAPLLVGVSPELIKRPADWPENCNTVLTGWWVVDSSEQEERVKSGDKMYGGTESQRLSEFLKGDPPVYLGWGSMSVVSRQHMTCLAVKALKKSGKRGIILGGWAELELETLAGLPDEAELRSYCKENILFMKTAPHAWLFPQCSCVVHHGGSGTTAAGVMAGVPNIITPVWIDQEDYAKAVAAKGIGLALPTLTKVTADQIAAAITKCCADGEMQAKAKAMGAATSARDGVGAAVSTISEWYDSSVATGKWRESFEKELQENKPKPKARCC